MPRSLAVDLADRASWLRETTDQEVEQRLRATFPPDRYREIYRSGTIVVLRALNAVGTGWSGPNLVRE